jgi:hypothetical protein
VKAQHQRDGDAAQRLELGQVRSGLRNPDRARHPGGLVHGGGVLSGSSGRSQPWSGPRIRSARQRRRGLRRRRRGRRGDANATRRVYTRSRSFRTRNGRSMPR